MAVVRVFGGKSYNPNYAGKNYVNEDAAQKVLSYMLREGDRDDSDLIPELVGGYGVNLKSVDTMVQDIKMVKDMYDKNDGRQIRHMAVSLNKEETEGISDLKAFAYEVCGYFGRDYQTVFAGHEKNNGVHIHICINSVGFRDGKKFSDRNGGLRKFKKFVEEQVETHCKSRKKEEQQR